MRTKSTILLLAVTAMLSSVFALDIPVLWERKNAAKDFQSAQAGFLQKDGKYYLAVTIKNLPAMAKQKGNIGVYWNFDGDLATGRFPQKQGVDLQINFNMQRIHATLIRWQDNSKRKDINNLCEPVFNGDNLLIPVPSEVVKDIKFTGKSTVGVYFNANGKRSDYIAFDTASSAKPGKVISFTAKAEKSYPAPAPGDVVTKLVWKRNTTREFKVSEAGVFQDDQKYIFAFRINGLQKMMAGKASAGFYWNSDGDLATGRFPKKQGVDVQFNIDLKNRRLNIVRWGNKDHNYLTVYEDDYLIEAVDDVLYIGLRKPVLTRCKVNNSGTFTFQYNVNGPLADRIYCTYDFNAPGKGKILPALKFTRFGALKSNRVKKAYAAPVTRPGAAATVWDCGAERFSPDEKTPAFSTPIPALQLKAARGETTSFFFAVEKSSVFRSLQIVPGTLTGGKNQLAADTQNIQYADYISDDRDNLFTDILMPSFPGKPVKRQFAVWHLSIPRDAAAGVYRGALKIVIDGKADKDIPVEVTVYDFAIPEIPAMRSAFSIKNGHLSPLKFDRLTKRNIYHTMLKRGAAFRFGPRLPGIEPKFKLDKDGKLQIFWDDFDRQAKYLFNELKVNTIQLPPGQLGSHDKFIRWNSILKKNYQNCDDPEFQSVLKQYAREYADHMKQLGFSDKMLFVIWDEPYGLEEPLKGARIVREAAPEIPIGIFTDRADASAKNIDIWLVTLQAVAETIKKAPGKRIWLYNSNGVNNFKLPASDIRSFFYLADKTGIEGFLSSEINVVSKSGCKDGVYFNHYPQHCLFYVSNDGKEVFDSWRLVLLRQGFNDYDYLAIYRKLLAKAGKPVPSWLTDAEPGFDAEGMPDFKVDTMKELDQLRDRIAREIEKLQ